MIKSRVGRGKLKDTLNSLPMRRRAVKLATFTQVGRTRIGLVDDSEAVDLAAAVPDSHRRCAPSCADPLTEVLRQGAQRLLAQAIEAEIAVLSVQYADHHDAQGRQAVVRNGYLPEREVHTGIGAVRIKVPRVRDRSGLGIHFHSAILPPYLANLQDEINQFPDSNFRLS